MIHAIIVFWLLFGSIAALIAMSKARSRERERDERLQRLGTYIENQPWKE